MLPNKFCPDHKSMTCTCRLRYQPKNQLIKMKYEKQNYSAKTSNKKVDIMIASQPLPKISSAIMGKVSLMI